MAVCRRPCLPNGAGADPGPATPYNYGFPAKWVRCQLAPSFVFGKDFLAGAMVIVNDGHGTASFVLLALVTAAERYTFGGVEGNESLIPKLSGSRNDMTAVADKERTKLNFHNWLSMLTNRVAAFY